MGELQHQLGTIFIINICMNVIELGVPFLKSKLRAYKDNKRMKVLLSQDETVNTTLDVYEEQGKLGEYETPLDDYMELIIDYGYVVMFSSAFPIVPVLVFLLNAIELELMHLSYLISLKDLFQGQLTQLENGKVSLSLLQYLGP